MINIVLVEHDVRDKEAISSLISSQDDLVIQGSGKDNYDAIVLIKKYKPDILLLNAAPESNDGAKISCVLKRYSPATAIVILCARVEDSLIHEMVKGSITGCLLKDSDMNRLVMILRGIHRGEHYINYRITRRALQILAGYYYGEARTRRAEPLAEDRLSVPLVPARNMRAKPDSIPANFSMGELKVLYYIAQGYSSKDIAASLFLKEGTVRNYISSIMRKAELKTRTQIVLYAQQHGFGRIKPSTVSL